jgi:hypothetical protein
MLIYQGVSIGVHRNLPTCPNGKSFKFHSRRCILKVKAPKQAARCEGAGLAHCHLTEVLEECHEGGISWFACVSMPRQEQLGLSIGYEPAWVVTNRIMGGQLRDKAWKGHVISRFRFGKIWIRYKSIQRTLQNFCLQGLLIKVCGPAGACNSI